MPVVGACLLRLIVYSLLLSAYSWSSAWANEPLTIEQLQSDIRELFYQSPDLNGLASGSASVNGRAYKISIFGGAAASIAHYCILKRKMNGEPKWFFNDILSHILRAGQDVDMIAERIDGQPEIEEDLKFLTTILGAHFRSVRVDLHGAKIAFSDGKRTVLPISRDNPEIINQNSDSVSTGIIQLGSHGIQITDLRLNKAGEPLFLRSLLDGKIEFLRSPHHSTTDRYKNGLNPEILSVVRFFVNSTRFDLEPKETKEVDEIVSQWNPQENTTDYVRNWIRKNASKIVTQSRNITTSLERFKNFELIRKLIQFDRDIDQRETLAWWLTREFLPPSRDQARHLMGQFKATGKTAADLGLNVVAHETSSAENYARILLHPYGKINGILSRSSAGQMANFGEGFYTLEGDLGLSNFSNGRGLHIKMKMRPEALEGIDFAVTPLKSGQRVVLLFHQEAAELLPPEPVHLQDLIHIINTGLKSGDPIDLTTKSYFVDRHINLLKNNILEILADNITDERFFALIILLTSSPDFIMNAIGIELLNLYKDELESRGQNLTQKLPKSMPLPSEKVYKHLKRIIQFSLGAGVIGFFGSIPISLIASNQLFELSPPAPQAIVLISLATSYLSALKILASSKWAHYFKKLDTLRDNLHFRNHMKALLHNAASRAAGPEAKARVLNDQTRQQCIEKIRTLNI